MQAVNEFVGKVNESIVNPLITLMIAIAVVVFLWGVFEFFIAGADNQQKRQQGTRHMLWGLIGFVIMFSVKGIIALIKGTLGV